MRYREPDRFKELRDAYRAWDRSFPPIPDDAQFHLVYTPETMARSSG